MNGSCIASKLRATKSESEEMRRCIQSFVSEPKERCHETGFDVAGAAGRGRWPKPCGAAARC